MNHKSYSKLTLCVIALTGLLLASTSQAQLMFHVDVLTSQLIGNPNAPFSLDFQFNNGSILGNNTATVSNFTYSGGSSTGSPTLLGGVAGGISSSVFFNNSGAFQELYQGFMPGSILGFDVSLTLNVDGVTPDLFSFGILDSSLFNIPTTGLGDSLLVVNLDGTNAVQVFSGTGQYSGITVLATVIPEPSTVALLTFAAVGVALYGRKMASRRRGLIRPARS